MKQHPLLNRMRRAFCAGPVLLSGIFMGYAADQVEMKNGDRYVGRIVSLAGDSLVMESDLVGTVKLPRSKVETIRLNAPPMVKGAATGTNGTALASNVVGKVEKAGAISAANAEESVGTILEGASPEARAKFNQMVAGLLSGKMTTEDIREEARSVAEQARSLRKDLGGEAGDVIDSYLAVLDRFLGETPATGATTNKVPPKVP